MKNEDVVYALTIEDLQVVAKVSYGKELSDEQLEIVSQKVGDYFDKVESAIVISLDLEKLEEPNWAEYPY